MEENAGVAVSEKNGVVVLLLCFFLGVFGAHRFYVGKIGTGILMIILTIVTAGIAGGIWFLIDFIIIVCGEFTDSEGKKIKLSN